MKLRRRTAENNHSKGSRARQGPVARALCAAGAALLLEGCAISARETTGLSAMPAATLKPEKKHRRRVPNAKLRLPAGGFLFRPPNLATVLTKALKGAGRHDREQLAEEFKRNAVDRGYNNYYRRLGQRRGWIIGLEIIARDRGTDDLLRRDIIRFLKLMAIGDVGGMEPIRSLSRLASFKTTRTDHSEGILRVLGDIGLDRERHPNPRACALAGVGGFVGRFSSVLYIRTFYPDHDGSPIRSLEEWEFRQKAFSIDTLGRAVDDESELVAREATGQLGLILERRLYFMPNSPDLEQRLETMTVGILLSASQQSRHEKVRELAREALAER